MAMVGFTPSVVRATIMAILVINGEGFKNKQKLVAELLNKFPTIKTIVKNVNTKNTNVILGNKNINLYGEGYITDILGDYSFKISPLSFYQVNPIQAEALYNIGVEEAGITKDDVVFDLYCGIGTITIFMSKFAKKVYGIEIVDAAIMNAKNNTIKNQINNATFICGKCEDEIKKLTLNEKIDVIVFDPPRKGCDEEFLKTVVKMKIPKIVYVSCNIATAARDFKYLENFGYVLTEVTPIDLFPRTNHVETVVLLELKNRP